MIGWGIIGVGDVTEVKANAAIFDAPGSRLVHVMRRTADAARDYAERHRVPRWSSDAQELIDDPQVSVVHVATPTSARGDQGRSFEVVDPPHVHGPLVASIINELQERGRCLGTGESALRSARTIDVILG